MEEPLAPTAIDYFGEDCDSDVTREGSVSPRPTGGDDTDEMEIVDDDSRDDEEELEEGEITEVMSEGLARLHQLPVDYELAMEADDEQEESSSDVERRVWRSREAKGKRVEKAPHSRDKDEEEVQDSDEEDHQHGLNSTAPSRAQATTVQSPWATDALLKLQTSAAAPVTPATPTPPTVLAPSIQAAKVVSQLLTAQAANSSSQGDRRNGDAASASDDIVVLSDGEDLPPPRRSGLRRSQDVLEKAPEKSQDANTKPKAKPRARPKPRAKPKAKNVRKGKTFAGADLDPSVFLAMQEQITSLSAQVERLEQSQEAQAKESRAQLERIETMMMTWV